MSLIIDYFNQQMEKRGIPISCDLILTDDCFIQFENLVVKYFGEGDFFFSKEEKQQFYLPGSVNTLWDSKRFKKGLELIDKAVLRKKLQEL